jgi:hypothetical protein
MFKIHPQGGRDTFVLRSGGFHGNPSFSNQGLGVSFLRGLEIRHGSTREAI